MSETNETPKINQGTVDEIKDATASMTANALKDLLVAESAESSPRKGVLHAVADALASLPVATTPASSSDTQQPVHDITHAQRLMAEQASAAEA